MSVEELIGETHRAFVDERIRERIEKGYSVDTCVLLNGLGFPGESRIKNIPGWLEEASFTIYNFTLSEAIKKIDETILVNSACGKQPHHLIGIKDRMRKKLDRPGVRIVDDPRLYKENFLKELNHNLFERLSSGSHYADPGKTIGMNDMRLLMASDYEKVKIVSLDQEVCRLAYYCDIGSVDTRIIRELPCEYRSDWREIIRPFYIRH